MTALTEFERLESPGAWRAGPEARLQEVVVSFGDATLILTDPKSDRPLAHWSLPAVTRLNPGQMPALYAPSIDAPDEQLEITEELMIDGIERVHRAIEARRAHPGRLRGGLMALAAVAMVAAGLLWLPQALIRHAARVAPPAQAAQVGDTVLAEIIRSTGAACQRDSGRSVLAHLSGKLLPTGARIVIVPADLQGARRLPGQLYVLGEDLLADGASADGLAGHLLAAALAPPAGAPIQQALDFAGTRATAQLLTSGKLPANSLQGYGEILLSDPAPRPDDDVLLAEMAQKGVSSEAYARSLDPTGETVLGLIEADPYGVQPPPSPVLTEPQWSALQLICAG
ncbi:hypothetical protein [Paracoccus tegillarcae]|uniref:Uncharacterized protein n=1 Tax=Paracoccus tegillarcae TaxID=1529068 RepID=A0A2K9EIN7_9RHOB|nr:hypothetical protein [Paracoccus tegillarcae]AUH34853.1 hypothetical protein CUV01_17020 [Paracoccus tegillarcae]